MEQLPPHVATADEPVPPLNGGSFEGPDLRLAPSIAEMLAALDDPDLSLDVVGYVALFRAQLASVGIDAFVMIERDGSRHLMTGGACDPQVRHRSRWAHFLFDHLDQIEERRHYLLARLAEEGRFSDNRPADPRRVTTAIRDFLRQGGRILVDPDGQLSEGGGIPAAFLDGTPREAGECLRAHRAYLDTRRRWRSDRQVKRAARMLGERTPNDWTVLEARQ